MSDDYKPRTVQVTVHLDDGVWDLTTDEEVARVITYELEYVIELDGFVRAEVAR